MSGRVQGVSYRANAANQARRRGITGYAKNLADGRVEVLACGPGEALDDFIEWLHRGPVFARVDAVEVGEARVEAVPTDFTTG